MKKILVTGATGFIGNYVMKELLLRNCEVIATSPNHTKAIATQWYSEVKYIPFDLNAFDNNIDYYSFFCKPDIMIHLAWEGLPNYKDAFHIQKNLPLHMGFLENMVNNGLTDLLVTGTCFEYGMKEGCLSEDMETEPANLYALAKDKLRRTLEKLAFERQIHFKWVRLFYMYGKGQGANSLFSQLDRALENKEPVFNMSGGEQERDFLPVEQVAKNIIDIALQKKVESIINCCSGKPVAVKDLVRQYLDQKRQKIKLNLGFYPYTDYEPMKFWGDNSKLKLITSDD
jgi:nucleoside-diphosphate-sugar epimerase